MDDVSDDSFATDGAGFDDRDFYQFNDIGLAVRFHSERARADADWSRER